MSTRVSFRFRSGDCSWIRASGCMLRNIWRGLREWCGDAAYEQYLRSLRTHSVLSRPLSAKEFYLDLLNRRYSRPNRCC